MSLAWVLTKGLNTCRTEFNTVFPLRDKASDGSVGDLAHQLESASGHNPDITGNAEYKDGDKINEVRAIDVDKDLRDASGNGITMEKVVQYLVKRARAGYYVPFRYIIFNGRIWSRSTGWATRTYTGKNKHDHHAHFSGDYTQKADNWTGSLGLATLTRKADPVTFDAAEKTYIDDKFKLTNFATGGGAGSPAGNGVLGHGYPRRGDAGEQRTPLYVNLQGLQNDVDDLKTASAANSATLNGIRSIVNFLDSDFPNDGDPEDDPIVKRIRYVMDNPSS